VYNIRQEMKQEDLAITGSLMIAGIIIGIAVIRSG